VQTEETVGSEGINDEEQAEDIDNDEGPPVPRDRGNVVPETVEGHQDAAEGDQYCEVWKGRGVTFRM
jgi:hypothetical protein